MFGQQFLINRPQGFEFDLDGVDIEQGDTEFVGSGHRNRARIRHLVVHEVGNQWFLGFAGIFGRFLNDLFRDNTVLYQAPW